jgi:hypothetical protein
VSPFSWSAPESRTTHGRTLAPVGQLLRSTAGADVLGSLKYEIPTPLRRQAMENGTPRGGWCFCGTSRGPQPDRQAEGIPLQRGGPTKASAIRTQVCSPPLHQNRHRGRPKCSRRVLRGAGHWTRCRRHAGVLARPDQWTALPGLRWGCRDHAERLRPWRRTGPDPASTALAAWSSKARAGVTR